MIFVKNCPTKIKEIIKNFYNAGKVISSGRHGRYIRISNYLGVKVYWDHNENPAKQAKFESSNLQKLSNKKINGHYICPRPYALDLSTPNEPLIFMENIEIKKQKSILKKRVALEKLLCKIWDKFNIVLDDHRIYDKESAKKWGSNSNNVLLDLNGNLKIIDFHPEYTKVK